jgi:hypothetical protein
MIGSNLSAQNRYLFPDKTINFSQSDWHEIMSDIANDSLVIQQIVHYHGTPVLLVNKPYVCYAGKERAIVMEFCPDCVWIVDSCTSKSGIGNLSITASGDYNFHLSGIISQNIWNLGDTISHLLLILCEPNPNFSECYLVLIASSEWVGTYTILPRKKLKRNKK